MGVNWKKWLGLGVTIASGIGGPAAAVATAVSMGANAVEQAIGDVKSGADKKATVLALVPTMVQALEAGVGKDILDDAEVQQATAEFNDAYVSLQNAYGHLHAAIEAAKAAKN